MTNLLVYAFVNKLYRKGAIILKDAEVFLAKCQRMLDKAAWKAAKTWDLEFDDVKSEAYSIFMYAFNKFEENGPASFSTYLFAQLRSLNDYCSREVRIRGRALPLFDESIEGTDLSGQIDVSFERFCDTLDLLEAATHLSNDARELLEYIFYGDWGIPGSNAKLSLASVQKIYREQGWMPTRVARAWNEIRTWYRTQVA
jgi:hypothetical protein